MTVADIEVSTTYYQGMPLYMHLWYELSQTVSFLLCKSCLELSYISVCLDYYLFI